MKKKIKIELAETNFNGNRWKINKLKTKVEGRDHRTAGPFRKLWKEAALKWKVSRGQGCTNRARPGKRQR